MYSLDDAIHRKENYHLLGRTKPLEFNSLLYLFNILENPFSMWYILKSSFIRKYNVQLILN